MSKLSNFSISLLLILFSLLIYLPDLGLSKLQQEEPRRAVVAQNMMDSGNYLVPQIQGDTYLAKPPLFNWMIAATSLPFSGRVTEFTAKLPSVISLLILALSFFYLFKHHLKYNFRIFLSLTILLSPYFVRKAGIAEIEILFVTLVSLSLWLWFYWDEKKPKSLRKWLVSGLFVGLAFLAKREPAVVFYALGISAYLIYKKRWREIFSFGPILSALITLAFSCLWLVPLIKTSGWQPFLKNFNNEVASRGLDVPWTNVIQQIATYPLEVFAALLPFSLILFLFFLKDIRKNFFKSDSNVAQFALIVSLINLPIYWFRGEVALRYFLPMFPSILVLITFSCQKLLSLEKTFKERTQEKFQKTLFFMKAFVFILSIILATAIIIMPLLANYRIGAEFFIGWPLILVLFALSIIIIYGQKYFFKNKSSISQFMALAISFCIIARIFDWAYISPLKRQKYDIERNAPQTISQIEKMIGKDSYIYAYGKYPTALDFYSKKDFFIYPKYFHTKAQKEESFYLKVQQSGDQLKSNLNKWMDKNNFSAQYLGKAVFRGWNFAIFAVKKQSL